MGQGSVVKEKCHSHPLPSDSRSESLPPPPSEFLCLYPHPFQPVAYIPILHSPSFFSKRKGESSKFCCCLTLGQGMCLKCLDTVIPLFQNT